MERVKKSDDLNFTKSKKLITGKEGEHRFNTTLITNLIDLDNRITMLNEKICTLIEKAGEMFKNYFMKDRSKKRRKKENRRKAQKR